MSRSFLVKFLSQLMIRGGLCSTLKFTECENEAIPMLAERTIIFKDSPCRSVIGHLQSLSRRDLPSAVPPPHLNRRRNLV